ncbi:MAG: DNA translocase FtsK [Christensenellales bacterium]
MQYISPLKNKQESSVKKKIAIALIIVSSIGYFALFTGFIGFLKHFLLGFFGLFAYPLFFCGYAISFMLFKDKKFVMPKRFVVYILLALFGILGIFHLAFSSYVTISSYGAYLSELYNSQLSVGGLLMGLITYPLIISIQYFGAYVVFGIVLIFSAYKIIDFFMINKNSNNFVKTNKKQKTRIEEVKISQGASRYLQEQIFSDDTNKTTEPKITVDAEIEQEESKRNLAKQRLGLMDKRNAQIKNNQIDTFEKVYNAKSETPIFSEENTNETELNNRLSNFDAFNSSSYSKTSSHKESKSSKQQNLDFLRATLDKDYHKQTTEEIAQMKKRNLNLEDNLKNLPINNLIKETENSKNFDETNNFDLQNEQQSTINQNFDHNISDESNQQNIKNSQQEYETKQSDIKNGEKVSDVKIDDLLNKVKQMESEQEFDSGLKYKQTNLLEKKGEPTKATYKKPSKYVYPTTNLLNSISTDASKYCENYQEKGQIIERTLENFKVPAKVIGVTCGPSVTRFELEMPPGISVNKINQYSNDIAMALASPHGVRIEAPIPGKSAVGVEVPNEEIATVGLREVLESKEFYGAKGKLTFALGKDINGNYRVCNMEKMPHLLIAGSTGSGKSVCLNVLLVSLLYKCSPEDLRIVLVDPKRVEFSMFNNLPHLLIPEVICSSDKAINALNFLIKEMERRYELFEELYVKKLDEYNETREVVSGEREKLPYIIMIIDEMNDLMSTNKKEIEDRVVRIAQKAGAAGIHLILATQRPSVDVITGTIKTNLPSRIAFAVTSFIDSKTILDRVGAEKLLGKGDMLYYPQDLPEPSRIQCAFVSNEEVKAVINFIKQNNESVFSEEAEREINKSDNSNGSSAMGYDPNELDSLLPEALKYVIEIGQASISKLQRHFALGFSRAGKIIDQMERLHYISPADGSRPRTVYLTMDEYRKLYGE